MKGRKQAAVLLAAGLWFFFSPNLLRELPRFRDTPGVFTHAEVDRASVLSQIDALINQLIGDFYGTPR